MSSLDHNCVDVNQCAQWLAEEFQAVYASGYHHLYTPFYCEENIHELSRRYLKLLSEKCLLQRYTSGHVLYISTEDRKTPVWHQKLCNNKADEVPVVWDYHVVFVIRILRTEGETETPPLPIENIRRDAPILRQDRCGAFASVVIDFDTSIAEVKDALFPGLIDLHHYIKLSFRAKSFRQ